MLASRFERFIGSLRAEATRITYESSIKKVLGKDPDAFLSMEPAEARELLVDYIVANRDRLTGATLSKRIDTGLYTKDVSRW